MIENYLEEAKSEIEKGAYKKGHPFRYFTLATVDKSNEAVLRTVVLRQVTEDFKLRVYTDRRSNKVQQLLHNSTASLLFYHPKKLLQLKVTGKATLVDDPEELQRYYSGVQPASRKDYTTEEAPGTPISNPDAVSYKEDKHHFCIIEIDPTAIEYLQLKRPNHIRVAFIKNGDEWEGKFLNP